MARLGAVILLAVCHTVVTSSGSALQIDAPLFQKAELGTKAVIACKFNVDKAPINLQYLAILWEFQGKSIVKFDNKGLDIHTKKYIDEGDITEQSANLYFYNASISDAGIYRCTVIYTPNIVFKEINFTVYARPSISALEKVIEGDKQNKILCSVTGFYPAQITVRMIKDGSDVSSSLIHERQKNQDNTFSITSSLILPSTDRPKSISCKVHHESLMAPVHKETQLLYSEDGDSAGLLVGVIAGVIILIVILGVIMFIYKKKRGAQVHQITGNKMIDGMKTALHCTASNCSQKTQVKWIIRNLIPFSLEVISQLLLLYRSYEPSLRPPISHGSCITRHVICIVTKIKNICLFSAARPQFSEPVQFTITDQGNVQLVVNSGKFYPKPLQISWESKRGTSSEKIPSQEEVTENPDATFNLTSKCTVSGETFKDPTWKVIITWKHESMDVLQSIELSAKDLPWRPQIGDYIEGDIQDDKIQLRCSVSDYFPDALTVRWFQKRKDCPDLIEVSESEKYTIPKIIENKTDKKTFMATCRLSLKTLLVTEKDVLLICRVDHPSLEKPIEAKTSPAAYRDTDVQSFFVNNIQGPQKWYNGEKVTLYCAAAYCTQGTRVIWIVTGKDGTEHEICEDSDLRKDGGHCAGYTAHRERTDASDLQGLQDITSCLGFTPSISQHKHIAISCKFICNERSKKKTFQRKQLYAKPQVLNPIKLSLTDSGDVQCVLDIEEFYPSNIQIKWNNEEKVDLNKQSENINSTYSVHSVYTLPGSFFRDPQCTVKVSWKHESMDDWEWRQMSALDRDFPWKPELREIPIPNLLAGITATLRCEVSNVFPDVLRVRWLKKEKDSQELFPLVHGDNYRISDITPERQQDNTFTYKGCLRFTPSISGDQGAEVILRVEHPSLGNPAEQSSGPLAIQDVKSSASSQDKIDSALPTPETGFGAPQDKIGDLRGKVQQKNHRPLIVGDIRGCNEWTHKQKVTLQCPVSYCPEDVTVMWAVTEGDGGVQELPGAASQPIKEKEALKTCGYHLTQETEESDVEGLYNVTSIMTFIPTVIQHYGCRITCTVTCRGDTTSKTFQPKSVHAKPRVVDPVKAVLTESGDVMCALTLQNFYPKHITIKWTTGQNPLTSQEDLQENTDRTYNICSRCTIPGRLLIDPDFKLSVRWRHKTMKERVRVLSWRDQDNSFPWRPVIQEVPVPHVLMGESLLLQYNISGYFPDAVTVHWYKKEKGAPASALIHNRDKYEILDTTSQGHPDSTYSCTARLRFTPTLKDQGTEIICRVEHPSLDGALERSSGPLHVQGKIKSRKPIKVTAGKEEMKYSLLLENFYPKDLHIEWLGLSEDVTQTFPSSEKYTNNIDKTHSVTSDCRVPEKDLKKPNFTVRVTWRHESMDDAGSREASIRDKDYPYRPDMKIQVPPLYDNNEAALVCTVSNYFPDAVNGAWLRKKKLSGETQYVVEDGMYRISSGGLGRQSNNTYSYQSCLIFTPSVDSDQGAEFIFQVEHPSLVQPMRKSTGALEIAGEQNSTGALEIAGEQNSTGALKIAGKIKSRKPIKVTAGKEEMKYSLLLENFYPKDLHIEWLGLSEDVTQTFPSSEKYTNNIDKTHSVTSDCRVPEKDLKKPNFTVRVTWRHESMDDAGSREASIRDKDYPYRPDMKIQVPPLYDNIEAALVCTVSNYFPDAVNGAWLRKKKLSGETQYVVEDGMYRISSGGLGRQSNNTYSYQSCLIFTPSVDSDQGAEFIFQVEHPSLVQPMRKSTGALEIAGDHNSTGALEIAGEQNSTGELKIADSEDVVSDMEQ
ncbi:uncharacterized protein [Engystomops pustulosus]|uniref:uncharacterized protein n=1 Tax=Engystomops pustulosus TaxID=76066 RepID=UPI003AFAF26B